MGYFIESIAGMLLVVIIMLSTLFFSNSQNETDVMRVKSEINDANFSVFSNDIDGNSKELELDNGKTITIKKSVTHPDNELIATYTLSDDKVATFKIKNIDGYAKVMSITDEKGKEIKDK